MANEIKSKFKWHQLTDNGIGFTQTWVMRVANSGCLVLTWTNNETASLTFAPGAGLADFGDVVAKE